MFSPAWLTDCQYYLYFTHYSQNKPETDTVTSKSLLTRDADKHKGFSHSVNRQIGLI